MQTSDRKQFAMLMAGVCFNYGRDATNEGMDLFWAALKDFDLTVVERAIAQHVRSSKFMPTVSELLAKIAACDPAMQRPGADEAWAMMPASEDLSLMWTEEMAAAWAVASGLLASGDRIGARMAFKDAYERAVESAQALGRPVKWSLCRGLAKDNLEDVVSEALRLGRIGREEARQHLLELEYVRPMNAALLLESARQAPSEAKAMEAVQRLKAFLTEPKPVTDWVTIQAELDEMGRRMESRGEDRRKVG